MKLKFTKMQATGNDYIYIDLISNDINIKDPGALSHKLSDRRFSIGADGIILICKSKIADAKMRMFNADASEGKMCGNGIRCVGKYLFDNGLVNKKEITIETLSGVKTLTIKEEKNNKVEKIRVNMGKPIFEPEKIPVRLKKEEILDYKVNVLGKDYLINTVSMGNPHNIIFIDEVKNLDLFKIGPFFESLDIFPEKVNTEFIKVVSDTELDMRVFERGSGETFSCGTGACASVVVATKKGFVKQKEEIKVNLKGGSLFIKYDEEVFLTGEAKEVFKGEIKV